MKKLKLSFIFISLAILINGCSVPFFSKKGVDYQEVDNYPRFRSKRVKKTSKKRFMATMRPYTICGKTYCPTYVKVGDTMKGIASWYGPNFHGRQTSNGEMYDMYDMTAAHKTWPMDTMVKVTNLRNGKSAIVRINDRGPFVKNRVLDCSYAAAKALGFDKRGTAPVKLEVVGFSGHVFHPKAGAKVPKVRLTNFAVQVGAFRRKEGAKSYKEKFLAMIKPPLGVTVKEYDVEGSPLYRVLITGFDSEAEAKDFIAKNGIDGFVIRP